MRSNSSQAGLTAFAALVFGVPCMAGVNLVRNGGFEQGFTWWNVPPNMPPGPNGALFFVSSGGDAHEGTHFAHLSSVQLQFISQGVQGTVPGADYELEFWLRRPLNFSHAQFTVRWEGEVVFQEFLLLPDNTGWHQFTIPLTSNISGSFLEFGQRIFPNEFHIDSISVRQVPSPSGLALLALGGLAVSRRSRH